MAVNGLDANVGKPKSATNVPLILFVTAIVLAAPAALGPVRLNDGFWIDFVWLEQFARSWSEGVLYPRWLPLSHGGLGSPVFYYYPPGAFYIASAFVLVGCSTYIALVATFATATLLSGVGTYLWLEGQTRRPVVGALIFMLAPYHLFNFYQRGAIAELVGTAVLPFVMLGIRRIAEGRRTGFVWTAFAYAALLMSHLPLALLASIFMIAPYAAIASQWSVRPLSRIAFALATGIGLAGIYLLPALMLDHYRSSADLWTLPYLQPWTWSLWSAQAWSDKTYRAMLIVVAAIAIPLVGLLARYRSPWGLWALAGALLAIGALPWLWALPLLRSVQFPFRLLPVVELLLATAVALAPTSKVPWIPLCASFLLMAGFIVTATPENANLTLATLHEKHPDVPENLPPGKRPFSWPSAWALEIAARHRDPRFDGQTTVEPVFYFPAWQVRCAGVAIPSRPDPETKLLTHAGRGCSRRIVWTQPEKTGAVVSLAALLALIIGSIATRRRRPAQAPFGHTRPNDEAAEHVP